MINFLFNKNAHRFDQTTLPTVTASGITNLGKIKFGNEDYLPISNSSPLTWNVANRTQLTEIDVKNVLRPTWTRDTGIDLTGSNDLIKSGETSGFTGAKFALNSANCGIEAKTTSINLTTAISLQSGTISYDFSTTDIEHCIVFGGSGIGSIYEKGVVKKTFQYVLGDSGMIEKRGDLIFYYKISATGKLTLIRATRPSLIDTDIQATVTLYFTGSALDNIFTWNGEQLAKNFQVYAVLQEQDWNNGSSLESLGETTITKDRQELTTYYSDLEQQITQSINLNWRKKEEYEEFKAFYQWHDKSEPFIFIDVARQIEYFAKFVEPFADNPIPKNIFGIQTSIRQMVDAPNLFVF